MKTTIELPDSLFRELKMHAQQKGLPIRRLVEEGIRIVLERDRKPRKPFKLEDGSMHMGETLTKSWEETRAVIYEGRGE